MTSPLRPTGSTETLIATAQSKRLYDYIAEWARMLPVRILNIPEWLKEVDPIGEENEPESNVRNRTDPGGTRELTRRDVCPGCRKYDQADRPPDGHPLTIRSGLTEGDPCWLNRADQADSDEDFQCEAFEPKRRH